jgi:hypothetical protein
MATHLDEAYSGPAIADLSGLTEGERAAVQAALRRTPSTAASAPQFSAGDWRVHQPNLSGCYPCENRDRALFDGEQGDGFEMQLLLGMQAEILSELERNNVWLARLVELLEARGWVTNRMPILLSRLRGERAELAELAGGGHSISKMPKRPAMGKKGSGRASVSTKPYGPQNQREGCAVTQSTTVA